MIEILSYAITAGKTCESESRWGADALEVFSGLRVYALSNRNSYIALVVFSLSAVPFVVNAAGVLLQLAIA